MLINRIDVKKTIKDNKNEEFTSNWNHSSKFKLITHINENYFFKNKFSKNTPFRDKIMNDSNKFKGVILPEIKTPNLFIKRENNNKYGNSNTSLRFSKSPKEINFKNNEMANDLFSGKTNFFKNIKVSTNSNNLNDNTQATTIVTNSTKKYSSSKINNIQSLNEDSSQYSMGIISAGSNNIIIPILTMRRPASNFNNGGGLIPNFNEIETNKEINKKKENLEQIVNYYNIKNGRNKIAKSQEVNGRFNASMKNKEIYNLFPGMQKFIPNFHKIKIEKGMTNINLSNSLSKNCL